MMNENCLVFEYHLVMFIILPARREVKDLAKKFNQFSLFLNKKKILSVKISFYIIIRYNNVFIFFF